MLSFRSKSRSFFPSSSVAGQPARSGSSAAGDDSSAQRQLAGRANKLLHWDCMLRYRALDYAHYDFGGISMGDALKAIDEQRRDGVSK